MIDWVWDGAGGIAMAAGAGAAVGWIVTRVTRGLCTPREGSPAELRAAVGVVLALTAAAAGLWWWEVDARGQLPAADAVVPRAVLAWRWAGHVVLLGFLAVATWIDLRERVIPDAITMPGVLAGLAWAGLRPASLPPVIREVPATLPAPPGQPDVLGFAGPLGDTVSSGWLGAAPALTGIGVANVLFVVWWLCCTAPAEPVPTGRRPFDPRLPALAIGLVGIAGAWWHGGAHWAALISSLVGMATGVAIVWATRIGASRALGREALGFGDVTLVAVIGAWIGWQGTVLACCLGVLVGLAHGILQLARRRGNELPFGPSLCGGAVLVIVLWRPLWARVAPVFERPHEIAIVAAAVIVLTALTLAVWWRFRGRSAA